MNLIKFQSFPLNACTGFDRSPDFQAELEHFFNAPALATDAAWAPALDVIEEKDSYVVKVELPGVNKEDVKLSLEQGTLSITGERKSETNAETATAYHTERFHGRFQRSINLPESITRDQVKAQYKDGVLTVTLPKSEEAKPRQIDIALN
jgi:HSP20 family protein